MKKIIPVIIFLILLGLGGLAVFLGNRIYQTRNESVSPISPESVPFAGEIDHCQTFAVTFNVVASPTEQATTEPSPSTIALASTSPTLAPSPTSTATTAPSQAATAASPTTNPTTNPTQSTTTSTPVPTTTNKTTTSTSTPTPTATSRLAAGPTATPAPKLMDSGVSAPTIIGISAAGILLILAVVLAL